MSDPGALIAQIYIGYFNRAPDPAGLNYWLGQLQSGMTPVAIATSFSRQPEASAAYNFPGASPGQPDVGGADAFLTSVYNNLFNRAPDAAGLAYWKSEIAAGKPTGRLIIDIISGAQGGDKSVIDAKTAAAQAYASQLGAAGDGFNIADARRVLAGSDANHASATPHDLQPQNLGAGNGLTISILDSSGTLAPYEAGIRQSVAAAWDLWAVHMTRSAPIEVEITFQRAAAGVLAFAGSAQEVFTNEIFNGRRITQSGVGSELQTGIDPNGAAADARITIAVDPARLVFRDSADDFLAADKLDALSIFAHEFGHVLGFRSALDASGAPLYSNFMTSYDRYVTARAVTGLNFAGPSVTEANGGSARLAGSGPAHLDEAGDLMAASLRAGQAKLVGVLDLAVLKDLGLPVSLAAFDGFA